MIEVHTGLVLTIEHAL